MLPDECTHHLIVRDPFVFHKSLNRYSTPHADPWRDVEEDAYLRLRERVRAWWLADVTPDTHLLSCLDSITLRRCTFKPLEFHTAENFMHMLACWPRRGELEGQKSLRCTIEVVLAEPVRSELSRVRWRLHAAGTDWDESVMSWIRGVVRCCDAIKVYKASAGDDEVMGLDGQPSDPQTRHRKRARPLEEGEDDEKRPEPRTIARDTQYAVVRALVEANRWQMDKTPRFMQLALPLTADVRRTLQDKYPATVFNL